MKTILSRGFNYQGQCGLGKNVNFIIDRFQPIYNFNSRILSVDTNLAHNFALLDGRNLFYKR